MRINLFQTNIILVLITAAVLSSKSKDYIQSKERIDVLIQKMKTTEKDLSIFVKSCEMISTIKHKKPEFEKVEYSNSYETFEGYWKLRDKIHSLRHKLGVFGTHTSFYLNTYFLYKDQVTNDIFIGTKEPIVVLCDAETVEINKKQMAQKSVNKYVIQTKEDMDIEYKRYKIGGWNTFIDTISLKRKVDKKTLIQFRNCNAQ